MEVFAVNKESGEIRKFKSMNACSLFLAAPSSAVVHALRRRGAVRGWSIVSKDTVREDILAAQGLLEKLEK